MILLLQLILKFTLNLKIPKKIYSTISMANSKSVNYGKKIALYEYAPSKSGKNPKNFLQCFSRFLKIDGYVGYNSVENITRVGCLIHVRRYYKEFSLK